MPNRILIVDDEPFNLDLLEQELAEQGYRAERARDGEEALDKLQASQPDLIFLDYMMPGMNGIEVLKEIRSRRIDVPVVMITAHGTIERAVEAMKEGAYDFVTKPFEPDHIALIVRKALERQKLKAEVEILSEQVESRYQLVGGHSPNMRQAVDAARTAANSKSTILLLGESGTGKEIFARSIHGWSDRAREPFVAINCVGLSRELLESELFGHEKGAFTGAHQLKKGKMEVADGGTVFLDEIGDISQELQTKLLRFLQEREFERLGGTKEIRVDVRIVAATNRDLEKAVKDGRFREDLYHRLNVIPIVLPPLRERKADIPILANHFMERFSIETKKSFTGIRAEALEQLIAYDWPGNVRELANTIERAVVLAPGPEIGPTDLPARMTAADAAQPPKGLSYKKAMDAYRRDLILKTLERTQGNRAAAAKALGLHRTHLMRLLRLLRINDSRF
jgi:DNA-binding NtrC family response regulator